VLIQNHNNGARLGCESQLVQDPYRQPSSPLLLRQLISKDGATARGPIPIRKREIQVPVAVKIHPNHPVIRSVNHVIRSQDVSESPVTLIEIEAISRDLNPFGPFIRS
jgi:hypothetical protein